MSFLLDNQLDIFITIEITSIISLLLFGVIRYFFNRKKLSRVFIFLFILLILAEALLAWVIYQHTGEISNVLVIIVIFVLYACTFGISDFKKLDRWMRKHIGKWRGVELLTDKDKQIMSKQKDPKYIAKVNRWSSLIHLLIFVAFQIGFWIYSGNTSQEIIEFLTDFSWIGEDWKKTPYANEALYGISAVWGIVFIVDFIYSWSYTFFPAKPKNNAE